jgi:hypothetical protein
MSGSKRLVVKLANGKALIKVSVSEGRAVHDRMCPSMYHPGPGGAGESR